MLVNNVIIIDPVTQSIKFQTTPGTSPWEITPAGLLKYNITNQKIIASTSDGTDNASLTLCAGGTDDVSRGAHAIFYGNEHASTGTIRFNIGNVSGGRFQILLTDAQHAFHILSATNVDRLRVEQSKTTQKHHAAFAGSSRTETTSPVNTTDATTTSLFTMSTIASGLSDNTTYKFSVQITGRLNSTTAKGVIGELRFGAYRNNAGNSVLIGTRLKEIDTYGSSGYDFDVDVTGTDLRIRVTGAAGETVSWACTVEFVAVSTST